MSGKTILLMGPPGSGKGTQAAMLESKGAVHISAGNLLRREVLDGTDLGHIVASIMEEGKLVDDNITSQLIHNALEAAGPDAAIVLDGYPRTLRQAHQLEYILHLVGRNNPLRFNLNAREEVLLERMSSRWICCDCQQPFNTQSNPPEVEGVCNGCGGELYQRTDDTPEAAKVRLETYNTETQEALTYMETLNGGVIGLDATHDMDTLHKTLHMLLMPEAYNVEV